MKKLSKAAGMILALLVLASCSAPAIEENPPVSEAVTPSAAIEAPGSSLTTSHWQPLNITKNRYYQRIDDYYNFEIEYPVLSDLSNAQAQDKINKEIYNRAFDIESGAELADMEWRNVEAEYYLIGGIYSVRLDIGCEYKGAPHPYRDTSSMAFNLETGCEFELTDVVADYELLNKLFDDGVFSLESGTYEETEDRDQYPKYDPNADPDFYLTEDSLGLIIDVPHQAGDVRTFEAKYTDLLECLTPEFKEQLDFGNRSVVESDENYTLVKSGEGNDTWFSYTLYKTVFAGRRVPIETRSFYRYEPEMTYLSSDVLQMTTFMGSKIFGQYYQTADNRISPVYPHPSLAQDYTVIYMDFADDFEVSGELALKVSNMFDPKAYTEEFKLGFAKTADPFYALLSAELDGDRLAVSYSIADGSEKRAELTLGETLPKWQKEYYRYASENQWCFSHMSLIDLNFDGTPELFEEGSGTGGRWTGDGISYSGGALHTIELWATKLCLLTDKNTGEKCWLSVNVSKMGASETEYTYSIFDFTNIGKPKVTEKLYFRFRNEYISEQAGYKNTVELRIDGTDKFLSDAEINSLTDQHNVESLEFDSMYLDDLWKDLNAQYDSSAVSPLWLHMWDAFTKSDDIVFAPFVAELSEWDKTLTAKERA